MSDEPEHPEDDSRGARRGKQMGFFDHLEELRWVLLKSVSAFLIFAVAVAYFLKQFNQALLWPLHRVVATHPGVNLELNSISIMEGFNVLFQMCVVGGLFLSAPFIAYFIGQFIAPALTEKETKVVLPIALSALVLFVAGAVFSFFFLVPSTLSVALEVNQMFDFGVKWTPGSYYSVLSWLVLGMGAAFEFPLVIVMLVWLGIMSTAFLRKYRRHAIVAIFIIAAVVTPTPDPINQTFVAAPLYFLYEVAIFVGARVERRRAVSEAAAG